MPRDGALIDLAALPRAPISLPRAAIPSRFDRFWVAGVMIATDIAVIEFSLYLGYLVRLLLSQWFPISLETTAYAGIAAGVPVVALCFYFMGLYPGYGISDVERLKQQQTGIAIIFSSLLLWDHLVQGGAWSRGILLATWFFAAILIPPAFAAIRSILIQSGHWGMPLAIIGAGKAGANLIGILRRDPRLGLRPIGILDSDPTLIGTRVSGLPVLGTLDDADELARSIRICAIAKPELDGQELADLSSRLPFPHVVLLPNFGTMPSAWVSPRDVGGTLGLEIKKNLLLYHNRLIKRVAELSICIPLLVLCVPVLAVLAALVWIISPGKPFFTQIREGRGGHPFRMFKLRTMYPDAEVRLEKYLRENPDRRAEWERCQKLRDDPRILPHVGKFLRQSSLDELPQLLNVLRGEMSLVGPRAFTSDHLNHFDGKFRAFRRIVTPGITGLWQVEVRSNGDMEDQKLHDTYYIRNWSLWLDLSILFKTVAVVLSRRGAM